MFLPFFFPAYGGAELATYNLARELNAQRLCNVTIWSLCKENRLYLKIPTENVDFTITDSVPLLRYASINLPKVKDLSLKLIIDLKNSKEDIIHFQGTTRLLSRLLLEESIKKKITVLTTHGLHESVQITRGALRILVNPLFINSLKRIDHIIALSTSDCNLLLSLGIREEKMTIIPNGIDDAKFKVRRDFVKKNNKLKLLCVARFDINKNHETLIRLVGKIAKNFDVELYLVGALANKSYFNKLIILTKKLNLESVVTFGVSLDDAAVVDCYLSCDLFILLSTMETSPIAIIEAMYAGLPVIVTRVGGIPEIVVDGVNGYFVSPHDLSQSFEQVVKLLKNRALRHEMGLRNKLLAKRYSWSQVAIATNLLYQKLTESDI